MEVLQKTDHARVIHEDKHKGMSAWASLLHSNMLPIYGREACQLLLYAIPGETRKDNNRRTSAGGIAVKGRWVWVSLLDSSMSPSDGREARRLVVES